MSSRNKKARDVNKGKMKRRRALEGAGGWVTEGLWAIAMILAFLLRVTGCQWEALNRDVPRFIHFLPPYWLMNFIQYSFKQIMNAY